jgi:hypothetical protein
MEQWKSQVRELLLETDPAKLRPGQARQLIRGNLPSCIYKYRSVSGYALQNLATNTVWMSSPEDLNDPFDTTQRVDGNHLFNTVLRRHGSTNARWEPIRRLIGNTEFQRTLKSDDPMSELFESAIRAEDKLPEEAQASLISAFISAVDNEMKRFASWWNGLVRDGVKVCSFSETGLEPLMWSHYADEHKGICIEWNLSALDAHDPLVNVLFPAFYTEERFDATPQLTSVIGGADPNPLLAIVAALHKDIRWKYEKEWRIAFPIGPGTASYNYGMPTPSAVYLGAKISHADQNKVIHIAEKQGIPVKQLKLSHDDYSLEIAD